ncbi:MAG: hypothetical protein JXA37_08515 [Chloroflexia bacterium]|nr:hypothetical protein [Chloroflexia bacterium]
MYLSEAKRWKRLLFERPLYLLLLLAALLGVAAYQVRRPQRIDVGGIHDVPYLADFHAPEPDRRQVPDPEQDFRWTREWVGVHLLGLGRQPLELRLHLRGYRPTGIEPPQATLWLAGTAVLSTPVEPDWQVYRLVLPADSLAAGNLHLLLQSETFRPAGDARDLGLLLDWIELHPLGASWVGPAWPQLGSLLGVALLSWLLLRRWGLNRTGILLLVGAVIALLAYLLAFHRLSLTHFFPILLLLLGAGVLLTALLLPPLERCQRRAGGTLAEARWLGALLLLGLLLRLGGMAYPQFRSSDLIFHAHRAEWVAQGTLLFTADLPDVNIPAPYPPGLYLFVQPLMLLSLDTPGLLQVVGVVLDAGCGLLLYLLARRLSVRPRAALLALLLQQVAPIGYWIFSWGNYTNLYSRFFLLVVLLLLCLGDWRYGRARGFALLCGAFSLVLLGHFADSLLLLVLVLSTAGLSLFSARGRRSTARLLAALALAGILALGLYYTASPAWPALLGGLRLFVGGESRPAMQFDMLPHVVDQITDHVPAPLILLAPLGLLLLPRRRPLWPLWAALLTAAVFFLGQVLFGFSTRYTLFVLPVLALGSAQVLDRWWERGRSGRLVAAALLLALVGNLLWQWWWIVGFGQR